MHSSFNIREDIDCQEEKHEGKSKNGPQFQHQRRYQAVITKKRIAELIMRSNSALHIITYRQTHAQLGDSHFT
jgi:hypothetical protein